MRNRLTAFSVALLFVPPLALTLAGLEWDAPAPIAGAVWLPALSGALAVLACGILFDTLTFLRTRHSLLRSQRSYLLWSSVAGAGAGLLLGYLNLFSGAWFTPAGSATQSLLFATLCGAVLLPAVLIARLWLAGWSGLVRLLTRKFAPPTLPAEPAAMLLLLATLSGLFGGTIWPEHMGWLFWSSPLLLLVALQLLWHESTVFAGLAQGDWSRILLGAVSGILVGGGALKAYQISGGAIYLTADTWQLIAYFALFGLLCLQLGDIVAENWRGKPRGEVFKKPFPIPVVSKKDQ